MTRTDPSPSTKRSSPVLWIALLSGLALLTVILLTAALTPAQLEPAYAAALAFADAAGKGDDAAAFDLLTPTMQTFVQANCPDGRVSACVDAYTPSEWGQMLSVVFRRAAPDGAAWDVELIATYAEAEGFSGVCIYQRMEADTNGVWRVAGWAGFVSCGDPASRGMAGNAAAPNRAP